MTEGYSPTITASRHLIGKDSFIISLAVSISLMERLEKKCQLIDRLIYYLTEQYWTDSICKGLNESEFKASRSGYTNIICM